MDVRSTDNGGLPPATSCAGTAHDTSGGGAATPAGALGSDAARGALLASPDARLTDAIGRLSIAVRDLKLAVDAWIARMHGGGTVGGSGGGGSMTGAPTKQVSAGSPVQGGGAVPTAATSRASAIPDLVPGSSEQLRLARNQVTYREVPVSGGAAGATFTPPIAPAGLAVEVYALRDYQQGAHHTQVLEPVTGPVTVAAGDSARFVVRLRGDAPGN